MINECKTQFYLSFQGNKMHKNCQLHFQLIFDFLKIINLFRKLLKCKEIYLIEQAMPGYFCMF